MTAPSRSDVTSITFTVPGEVRGQGRTGGNGKLRFTPQATRLYENRIAMAGAEAMVGRELFGGPLSMLITASFQPPPSASGKRQRAMLAGELHPTKKPDWDNIGKTTDALKGIVWKDDTQVVRGTVVKRYAPTPGLEITIMEILP